MIQSYRRAVDAASLAGILSGVGYGVYAYFLQFEGEWGPEPYPAQALWQHAHVLLVPGLVFVFGLLWRIHIAAHYQGATSERRYSGILLVGLMLAMIVSGYALQVTIDETLNTVWVVSHVISSCAFAVLYVLHRFFRFL